MARTVRSISRWALVSLAALVLVTVATPGAGARPLASSAQAGHRHHHRRHHRHHRRHRHRHHHRANATAALDQWSATAPCANADTPATSSNLSQMDAAVECLVNQQRLRFGLAAMNVSSKLTSSAQSWTQVMISSGNFTHGTNLGGRLSAVGYPWQEGGENIATGYLTPRDVVAAWMASPDHCTNILDPDYRDMGTGEIAAPVGTWASAPATWTQDFGLTFSQSPLSHNTAPQSGCPYTIPSSPA